MALDLDFLFHVAPNLAPVEESSFLCFLLP
jgi:hypothetical protein